MSCPIVECFRHLIAPGARLLGMPLTNLGGGRWEGIGPARERVAKQQDRGSESGNSIGLLWRGVLEFSPALSATYSAAV
jgi:hypothetical protein